MINLVIFLISFIIWLILCIKNKFGWYTYVLSFIWGAFLAQTILWLCGVKTLI